MKKTLILAAAAAFLMSASMSMAATSAQPTQESAKSPKAECPKGPDFKRPPHKGPNLDERLKLTEEQKAQAKAIRMKGHEKIKPVMEQIKAKKQEADAVKMSRISTAAQEEKLEQIKKEMHALRQEARTIRHENMKEFESILTAEQKAEFEKIKQEGRENFKKHHPRPRDGECPKRGEKPKR